MPATVPVPTKSPGDVLTSALWNTYVAGNINKLLNQAHRRLTVSQFNALTGIEDGDEVYLEVDATNGIEWHLVYDSSETTYKWRFVGGSPLVAEVTTAEATGGTAYAALTTAGPSIALPRAGDYDVEIGAKVTGASASSSGFMSYDIGGTGAVDADSVNQGIGGGGTQGFGPTEGSKMRRKAALTAVTLLAKYKHAGSSTTIANRGIRVTPVRII